MTTLIDGKAFAATFRETIAEKVSQLKDQHDLQPGLAVVLVGEDPASQVYVRNKNKATVKAGMQSFEYKLPEDTSQEDVISLVKKLNADPSVHGILVQMPLPKHINELEVINCIDPLKDVDGLTEINTGRLALGSDCLVPCTPQGCILLLKDSLGDLTGKNAVVVGRSILVGKPVAQLLLAENCTVTIAHSRTQDLPDVCKEADILVAAVGRPEMIKGDWIKAGATVIDVGINRVDGADEGKTKLVGDVAYAQAFDHAAAITPVPGGVGPMTIACLLANTVKAACLQHKIDGIELF